MGPGKYASDKDSCLGCASGYYQPSAGKTKCEPCKPGTAVYINYTANPDRAGAVKCSLCSPGHYQPLTNATHCGECEKNFFSNTSGMSQCFACPAGMRTDHDKQDHCMYWPTSAPTGQPTSPPTVTPTSKPTAKPSAAPTAIPSSKPTSMPTNPTSKPSPAPTFAPTAKPTEAGGAGALSQNSAGSTSNGSNSAAIAGGTVAAILICCCIAFCLYRRKQRKDEKPDEQLTPYEKWMRNEELKNQGAAPANASTHNEMHQNPMIDGSGSQGGPPQITNGPPGTPGPYEGQNGSTHNPLGSYNQEVSLGQLAGQNPMYEGGSNHAPGSLHEPDPAGGFDQGYEDYDQQFEGSNPQQGRGSSFGAPPPRSMSPGGSMRAMPRPSQGANPLRGAAGRRGSAMGSGRPNSDAAAAYMARKKRQSQGGM